MNNIFEVQNMGTTRKQRTGNRTPLIVRGNIQSITMVIWPHSIPLQLAFTLHTLQYLYDFNSAA